MNLRFWLAGESKGRLGLLQVESPVKYHPPDLAFDFSGGLAMHWWEYPPSRWYSQHKYVNCLKYGHRPRDSQRAKAYAAERFAFMDCFGWGRQDFKSIKAIQAYVNKVTRCAWFRRRWGKRDIKVSFKPYGSATGGFGSIRLPRWAWTRPVILHEMAHCLSPAGGPYGPGHGRLWARTYLELVRYALGLKPYEALRDAYRAQRVKFHPLREKKSGMRLAACRNVS